MKEVSKYLKISETGEQDFAIKYLIGRPRQYRFNGQTGRFNINGTQDVGTSLTFQPVAWRIFEESLFGRQRSEVWAELFFVDESACLSSIMFNNSSVNELYNLIEPLFYDDLTLADVILTVTADKKENTKIQPKGTWYLAQFAYVPADGKDTDALRSFALTHPILREDTLTDTAVPRVTAYTYAVGYTHAVRELEAQAS